MYGEMSASDGTAKSVKSLAVYVCTTQTQWRARMESQAYNSQWQEDEMMTSTCTAFDFVCNLNAQKIVFAFYLNTPLG